MTEHSPNFSSPAELEAEGTPQRARRGPERVQLSDFSSHILADIGLTQADVDQEAVRPFWYSVLPKLRRRR